MPGIKRLLALIVAALLLLTPAAIAQGAPGGGPGKPDGVGNGGGGGGNPNKGPGNKLGDLYADLMVIARYVDGTPIVDQEKCLRPIWHPEPGEEVPVDFTEVPSTVNSKAVYPYAQTEYYIPLVWEEVPVASSAVTAEAEDEDELEPCDVQADYLGYVEEVDLGRLNLGRSPDRVLNKQLGDVEIFLTSGATIGLDASGRFTRIVDEVVVQTLDSPLANMAAYRSILKSLPATIGEVPVLGLGVDLTDWELTAAQFAAAAPKEDFVITVDTAQYLNRILGIPNATPRDTLYEANLGRRFWTTRASATRAPRCSRDASSGTRSAAAR